MLVCQLGRWRGGYRVCAQAERRVLTCCMTENVMLKVLTPLRPTKPNGDVSPKLQQYYKFVVDCSLTNKLAVEMCCVSCGLYSLGGALSIVQIKALCYLYLFLIFE